MTSAQTHADRAVATYHAMQKNFSVGDGTSLYRQTFPWSGGNAYSYLWEFSRALVGTLALAGVPGELVDGTNYAPAVQDRFAALGRYWDARLHPPAYASYVIGGGGGDTYYDDNAWVALAFIQQYRMGLSASLDPAKQLFAFARAGWDTNTTDPCPGGVFWVKQGSGYGLSNHDRGTGATAGSAELGYHLRLLTGDPSPAADDMANWVNAYADSSGGGTGLFWNAVRRDGSVDTNLWSYNQGVMIGANLLRYQVTANRSYLATSVAIANKALASYANFQGQPPSFNAMLFQNMLMLYPYASISLQATVWHSMDSYADWAWNTSSARDPNTSLFYFDDAGRPAAGTGQAAQLRDQGAMTQLYALLAWRPSNYGKLT